MLIDSLAGALSGHLNQAQRRDMTDFTAILIGLECSLKCNFHLTAVCCVAHVDQVEDKNSAHVTQA